MNYLKYIEHNAENLQFYLWFRNYKTRFANLPDSEKSLSPEWTKELAHADTAAYRTGSTCKKMTLETAEVMKAFDEEHGNKKPENGNPFNESHESTTTDHDAASMDTRAQSAMLSTKSGFSQKTESAFEEAGLKWQPCLALLIPLPINYLIDCILVTVQPFREEISRIISIYIASGGPRLLNLSSKDCTNLLHALEITTHPSAFRNVISTVECTLRFQSHPSFIRWTICNGNRPRVIFARGLGIFGILGGIITGILLCLSSAGRGWRVMALIPFMIGVSTLIAAWKGMCVVLHGMHHRHLRPWELFRGDDINEELKIENPFDTQKPNSYEDEPWVAKYQKRNLIRKIFDREVWIQEPALRQIQDTIFVQALVGAFVISVIAVGIFCAVPHGDFY